MKFYWVKTNWFIKKLFFNYFWSIPTNDKIVYLTFDDGPTENITHWVLSNLETFHAKATFFCIGNNVQKNPILFKTILQKGHKIGNHTFSHLKGWNTSFEMYLENIFRCEQVFEKEKLTTNLFRPPYGKITFKQAKKLREKGCKIIMWDVLSADFDTTISPEKCLQNVIQNVCPGSIIVFHDSHKAFKNLQYVLPKTLAFLEENGYKCNVLD